MTCSLNIARIFQIFLIYLAICSCICQLQVTRYTIVEESGPQLVGTLNIPQGTTYRLSTPNNFFELNGNTGELKTIQSINRELLEDSTIALLAVAATGSAAPIEILIEVTDINDNDPVFPDTEPVTLDILESIEVGTQYFLPTATDADASKNGVSDKYEIVDGDTGKFSLLVDSSPGDQTLLYLNTKQQFDREDIDHYELNISATDDGQPPRKGFLSVQINILDSNDNAPLFDFSQYTVTIPENTSVGTIILTASASDFDQGNNGLVRYRIGPQVVGEDFFAIDPITGNLTLKESLDYETSTNHRLTLEAYDAGTPVLFGRAFVAITVENVNDNTPSINFRFIPFSASIASVNEGVARGTTIAFASVTDDDSSRLSEASLSLTLANGNHLNHFALVEISNLNSWRLNVIGTIDRSIVPRYNLTICAEDSHLTVTQTSCRSLEVVVNSPNNHAPIFLQDKHYATLSEIAPVGSYVALVSAADLDIGITGRLKYRISAGNSLDWFQIEALSGVITTKQNIDYDILNETMLHLSIVAQDESSNPRSSMAFLFINITAENDNVPRFASPIYEVTVQSTPLPRNIIQVVAEDKDIDVGVNQEYAILSVRPLYKYDSFILPRFIIDQTGLIRLQSLPFSISNLVTYEITVMVTDDGQPHLSSTTIVQVTITPNQSPSLNFYPDQYFAQISHGLYSDFTIVTLSARISGQNGNSVRYNIIAGDNSFKIDDVSGRLFITNRNFQSSGFFVIQVSASFGNITATSPATVYVAVVDSVSVSFDHAEYRYQILENSEPFSVISTVEAKTSDSSNSTLTYRISEGDRNGNFDLIGSTGVLSLSSISKIDFEENRLFNLTITAMARDSAGSFVGFSTAQIIITVIDVNDNPPIFVGGRKLNESNSKTFFQEMVVFRQTGDQAYVGNVLYNATATDCDDGLNGRTTYLIDDPLDALAIDADGLVSLKRPLPNLAYDYFDNVTVTSCDNGSPRLCNDLHLQVAVQVWLGKAISYSNVKNRIIQAQISESTPAGSIVVNLSCNLPRRFANPTTIGQNGTVLTVVSYVIADGNPNSLFGISPGGQVYLKRAELDREYTSYYDLIITITIFDGEHSFNVNSSVGIFVDDVNDNTPQFSNQKASFSVFENEPAHTLVGYVQARDNDKGIHSSLVYLINDNKNYSRLLKPLPFAVNKYTGAIYTLCKLDLETLDEVWNDFLLNLNTFAFRVTALDSAGVESRSTLSSDVIVQIHVQNRNEFHPEFLRSFYITNITEDAEVAAPVLQLFATDRDQNSTLLYQILSRDTALPFDINSSTGLITVSGSLNREIQPQYIISVSASDGNSSTSFTSTATVQINILDVNDNKPEFDSSRLRFHVTEGANLHQIIGQISATDLDEQGQNDKIVFLLSSQNSLAVRQTFRVEESSGYIVLMNTLDRETQAFYTLTVEASDSAIPHKLTSTATVQINVDDINDNSPRINLPKSFKVEEGTYTSSILLGTLTASDNDVGENGQISFAIVKQTPALPSVSITLVRDSGRLLLEGDLDREKLGANSKILLLVQVSDNPNNEKDRLLTQDVVEIVVGDINDNDPTVTSPDSILLSTNSIGEIATLTVNDPDNGVNGSVQFSQSLANSNQWFRVQAHTGVLELYNALPLDQSNVFAFNVGLQDGGFPQRLSLSSVYVLFGDTQSQNGPRFLSSLYSVSIPENVPIGSRVLSVSATGNDVNYFITGVSRGGSDGVVLARRPFAIDSSSGSITTLLELDAEDLSTYSINVVAVDMTSTVRNPRMTMTQVSITVTDVNDNHPEFANTLVEVRVSEDVEHGFMVAFISATDADVTSTLAYSLLLNQNSEKFRINSTTGAVLVVDTLDAEERSRYILTVIASDGVHQARAYLTVNIDDVNDNDPEFSNPYFVFAIQESFSTPPSSGKFIASVSAHDVDSSSSSIFHSFLNGSDQGLFQLDSYTGLLSLNSSYLGEFDRETRDLYVFIIRATDNEGRFADALVYVNVEDANDNAPAFANKSITVEIPEDVNIGHTVTTVHAEDSDLGFNGMVEYKIVGGDQFNQFFIALDTGVITTRKPLDRELKAEYKLLIMASDLAERKSRLHAYITVTVLLSDVNDNPPSLILLENLFVAENIVPGTVISTVGALDYDTESSGVTSSLRFAILSQEPSSPAFSLDPISGVLSLERAGLDRESNSAYNLSIVVSDQDFATAGSATIFVTDLNDNTPALDLPSDEITVFVNENAKVGHAIATVRATDFDEGYNGLVKFRLREPIKSSNFAIDSTTGVIYLIGSLDFENKSQHALVVEAYDCGIPTRVTSANVILNVIDVNDNAPIMTPSSAIVHAKESMDSSQNLLQFEVSDADSGNSGRVDFRIATVTNVMKDGVSLSVSQSSVSNLFRLSGSGELISTRALNKEEVDSYTVVITAVDRGAPTLTASSTVLVVIDDVNEFAPTFQPSFYQSTVYENANVGEIVLNVTALDRDAGLFGRVRYNLLTNNVPFVVNPTTGDVIIAESLDRESQEIYEFVITASDSEDVMALSPSSTITITILDVNDNSPQFDQKLFSFVTDASAGRICGVVFATDADHGSNGKVSYELFGSASFQIDSDSGMITSTSPLALSSYNLQVVARDNGVPQLTDNANVTISVQDVNFPIFSSQSTSPITIQENLAFDNLTLFTFQVNSLTSVQYYLVGGNIGNYFSLNKASGELKRIKPLDRESQAQFKLWIEAKKLDDARTASYTSLIIEVLDTNDNPPKFSAGSYIAHVREDEVNSILTTVSASDPDTASGSSFEFALLPGESENSERFILDPQTGILRNRQLLDREEKDRYVLTITATDREVPSLVSRATVEVIVDDVNDNGPQFTRLHSATVRENAMVGEFVVLVTSTDLDTNSNSQNRYSLSEDANGTFAIDPVSGVVTIKKPLNREQQSRYSLQVMASDDFWSAHTTITVDVTDFNDNVPRFNQSSYRIDINTGLENGSRLLQLKASDLDEGRNAEVYFQIVSDTNLFSINHNSGEIFTTALLRCSSEPDSLLAACPTTFTLTVKVTDCGFPISLSSTTTVTVRVHAVNKFSPFFESDIFPKAVLNSATSGFPIFTLHAFDDDGDAVRYEITGGSHQDHFLIDEISGLLSTAQNLVTNSLGTMLRVIVQAEDDGFPKKSTEITAVVEITGENNNRPAFGQSSFTASAIPEDIAPGSPVITITATDSDNGINGKVLYTLGQNDGDKPFAINRSTGLIYTTDQLDYETTSTYILTIVAQDCGMISMQANVTLIIAVSDVNDNIPRFNDSYFVAYVPENIAPRSQITRVVAADLDSGENAVIEYSVFPQDFFVARSATGDIFAARNTQLDFEARSSYQVMVVAFNDQEAEKFQFNDSTILKVVVTDRNEYVPTVNNAELNLAITQFSLPGQVITRLEVSDQDGGPKGKILFILAGWSENMGFAINQNTGELTVAENPRLLLGSVINITVFIKNPGLYDPALTLRLDMTVSVISEECMQNPCRNGATCQDGNPTFVCVCLPGYSGILCDENIDDCRSNPCNNGVCTDLVNGFSCSCSVGFTGETCNEDIDFCNEDPCQNNGTCVDGITSYNCLCLFGTTGTKCEINSLGFEPLSYLRLSSFQPVENNVNFEFATVLSSALLLYTHAGNNVNDYVALEIIDGRLRASFKLEDVNNNRASRFLVGDNLSDGLWHQVNFSINNNQMKITVDECATLESECSRTEVYSSSVNNPFSRLSFGPLFIGGVQNYTEILNHPGQVSANDFVGCIRSFRVNSIEVDRATHPRILQASRVTSGCPRNEATNGGDACVRTDNSPVCGSEAVCVDTWSSVLCECPEGRSGRRCQNERAGSTFDGNNFLAYVFASNFVQNQILLASGAFFFSATSRKKRTTALGESSISVRFRTRKAEGLLLYVQGRDAAMFASLQIRNGLLSYTYSSSAGEQEHELFRVDDGLWHDVDISLIANSAGNRLLIAFEANRIAVNQIVGSITNFVDVQQVQTFYVGGTPNSNRRFEGCIFSFKINNQSQPLGDDGQSAIFETTQLSNAGSNVPGVIQGCSGSDVCVSNPCPQGEFCNDIWETFECIPLGQCNSTPCLNGATCIPTSAESYSCRCAANYTGQNCATFVPCLSIDCSLQGPNRECIADEFAQPECSCIEGYLEQSGKCVSSLRSTATAWWVYASSIAGFIIVTACFAIVVCCFIKKRQKQLKKTTAACEDVYSEIKKPSRKTANGNSTAYLEQVSTNSEFDRIPSSPKIIQHAEQSNTNSLRENEIVGNEDPTDEISSSGIGSTESTSPIKEKSSVSHSSLLNEAEQRKVLEEGHKKLFSPLPSSPLPSYELALQQRYGVIVSENHLKQPPFKEVYERVEDDSTSPSIPSNFFHHCSEGSQSESSSSHQPPSTRSNSSIEKSVPPSVLSAPRVIASRPNLNANLKILNTQRIAYIPNGRVSPTKSPSAFAFKPQDFSLQENFVPRKSLRSRKPKKLPSSDGFSSSSSSSYGHKTPTPIKSSVEEMVKHLNGIVGLTPKEIEILSENPATSLGYMSSSSESTSGAPSLNQRTHRIPLNRPSSLPGQKIQKVPDSVRSRTPMFIPSSAIYNSCVGSSSTYHGLRPDPHSSPNILPDASSENDDFVHQQNSDCSSSAEERDDAYDNHISKNSSYMRNKLYNPDESVRLDFLMSYGKHYEGLAGIFEDLAALPAFEDEEQSQSESIPKPNFASTSFISQKFLNPTEISLLNSDSCNSSRSRIMSPHELSSAIPNSVYSSSTHPKTPKRQEHYV